MTEKVNPVLRRVSSSGVVANVMDYDLVISEFELPSHFYVHFRTNTRGTDTKPPNLTPFFFYKDAACFK